MKITEEEKNAIEIVLDLVERIGDQAEERSANGATPMHIEFLPDSERFKELEVNLDEMLTIEEILSIMFLNPKYQFCYD